MANAEEFGDFGSHFLDSMLEVEMTEEDGEVKIMHAEEAQSNTELPPIPRFDLQSGTLTHVFESAPVIPTKQTSVLRPVPAPMPGTKIAVPVMQPAPMIVIPSNLLKPNHVTSKPNSVGNATQINTGKPSPVLKALLTKVPGTQDSAVQFLQRLFSADYVKKVYSKPGGHGNVSEVSEEENLYYKSAFEDVGNVQLCRLHCTICDKHLGCGRDVEKRINVHSMLKVLTCKVCYEFYGDGNFPCDDGDHCEIYCRWCGQGGALICCSFCPKVFCKRCVRRNYARSYLKAIEKASDWACFVCAQKPLWPHRAVCRALVEFLNRKKTDPKSPNKDTSVCCKSSLVKKKIISEADRNKIFLSGGQTIEIKTNGKEQAVQAKSTTPEVKNKVLPPMPKAMTGNGHLVIKNFPPSFKLNDSTETSITVTGRNSTGPVVSKMSNLSSIPKNNTKRTSNTVPPLTSISGIAIPAIINTPIYHGQTLITPPGARNVNLNNNGTTQKKPTPKKTSPSSSVKVSVTDCVNVDINKIPVAKIPRNGKGVVLRLNFPDNKVQLVRLVPEGGEEGETESFPMPKFENSENLDFLEGSLEDSFKLTKMLYERLMKIKEKLNSKTRFTKDSVYKSSVKKLSFIYEKARELMKELDENLLANYENWKSEQEQENEIKVIDLSDDEGSPGKERSSSIFEKKSKIFGQDDDSDLDVIVAGSVGQSFLPRVENRSLRGLVKGNVVLRGRTRDAPKSAKPSELVDVSKIDGNSGLKRKTVGRRWGDGGKAGRSRKKMRAMDDDVVEILEKDPLAVSDTEEPHINGQAYDDVAFLGSVAVIKQEVKD